ncbi:hypothetical protein EON63_18205 [archaeon]|nr:MAG: hypothetical protein EON63_18205 [archaeon]
MSEYHKISSNWLYWFPLVYTSLFNSPGYKCIQLITPQPSHTATTHHTHIRYTNTHQHVHHSK